jgi:transcriptional regulator with XRE-family HTH domain
MGSDGRRRRTIQVAFGLIRVYKRDMESAAGTSSGVAFSRLRMLAGLSARQLATRSGVHVSSVWRVERGEYVKREVRDALVLVLGSDARALISVRRPDRPLTPLYLARLSRGESGREAAKRAGVSKDVFFRAQRGERVHPANAAKIARAFDMDIGLIGLGRPMSGRDAA